MKNKENLQQSHYLRKKSKIQIHEMNSLYHQTQRDKFLRDVYIFVLKLFNENFYNYY